MLSGDHRRTGPAVVLVGPPGAGTSTVAREVGGLRGLTVRDTDRDVEQLAGASVPEIFIHEGEARFRELERKVVLEALAEHDGVLAVGGGAVMDPRTEVDLREHFVVFLDVSVSHAARRIGLNKERPTHLVNPRAQWLRMMEGRRPVYERVSTARVVTDDKTVEQVAVEVVSLMNELR